MLTAEVIKSKLAPYFARRCEVLMAYHVSDLGEDNGNG